MLFKSTEVFGRRSELGGSRITLTIVLVVLALSIFAGYNFIPIAFADSDIKTQLQTIATNAVILPASTTGNNQINWTTTELNHLAQQYEIPTEAFKAEMSGPAVKCTIKLKRKIPILPFGIYTYEYDFNFSATSAGYASGAGK
ncbi:MAG: hypothetical protein ABIP75_16215 [Pyrinomonadaceae bacterium]